MYFFLIFLQKFFSFDMVSAEDCDPPDNASVASIKSMTDEDALSKLHQQLASQLKICLTNRDHYREMGNIAEMNRFEHAAVRVKQDLDVVSVAKRLVLLSNVYNVAVTSRYKFDVFLE